MSELSLNYNTRIEKNVRENKGNNNITPMWDCVFKKVFSLKDNRASLINFLSAITKLPENELENLTLVDPNEFGERIENKNGILDLKIELTNGKIIGIEVQVCMTADMSERLIHRQSTIYAGQLELGEDYSEVVENHVILMATQGLKNFGETNEYYDQFYWASFKTKRTLSEKFVIHLLDLSKLPNNPDVNDLLLWEWGEYFKFKDRGEIEVLAKKNEHIGKVYNTFLLLTENEKEQYKAREIQANKNFQRMSINTARREGREEGREEGVLITAKKLLVANVSLDVIHSTTGLSYNELEKLKQQK